MRDDRRAPGRSRRLRRRRRHESASSFAVRGACPNGYERASRARSKSKDKGSKAASNDEAYDRFPPFRKVRDIRFQALIQSELSADGRPLRPSKFAWTPAAVDNSVSVPRL